MAKRKSKEWLYALIGGVSIFLLGVWGISSSGDDNAPSDDSVAQAKAWGYCKDAVREHLRNPDSADFSLVSTKITKHENDGYDIAGSLNATNDFGTPITLAYSCKVTDSHATATVTR